MSPLMCLSTAPEADHPLRKAQLRSDADTMRSLIPPVVPTSGALFASPNDAEKDKALVDLIDRIKVTYYSPPRQIIDR